MLPRFYAIVDRNVARAHGWTVPALARACLDGGARLLQVRAKNVGAGELLDLCAEIGADAAARGATLIVNDRADVARLVPGAGVHVGQDDLAPALARQVVGPHAIVGFSTHTTGQVDAATGEPISYLAVGPIFGTRTKDTGYEAVGFDLVRHAARVSRIPVVAIGGITLDRAREVLDAGASSVAVISDVLATGNPAARVAAFLAEIGD